MTETMTETQNITDTDIVQEFTVSDSAARRIQALVDQEGIQGQMFRVTVSGGGCSGFQYGFDFDDTQNDDDRVFENAGIAGIGVLVDEASLPFLSGAVLDFKEELIGSFFAITNPNAASTCGCGTSFSI